MAAPTRAASGTGSGGSSMFSCTSTSSSTDIML